MPRKNASPRRDQRTPLVLTFDDGYRDHYTHALALSRELQVPITIFLIPGYIQNGDRFWWREAEHLVRHAQVSEATIEGRTYHLDTPAERNALAQVIDARVRYAASVAQREEFLIAVRKVLAEPPYTMTEEQATLPLTWAQVKVAEESGWISYGAHTMHHPILAELTDPAEVLFEVSECRVVLERQLGHAVRTFAYPVGQPEHIGAHGLPAVREAGYDWAVTTIQGFNTAHTDPYLLRRIVVDVDQHWLSVAAKASGVWGFFTDLYRMPRRLIREHLRTGRQQ